MKPPPTTRWRPLLVGDTAARAWAAIDSIAEQLRALPLGQDASLANGHAGQAVFFAHLDTSRPGQGHAAHAAALLDAATTAVAETPMEPSLYEGFTGVAWALESLRPRGEDPSGDLDAALLELLGQAPWDSAYDLVEGLVGLGVYALERLARPSGAPLVERVVERLGELARPLGPGLTWWTSPEWMRPGLRAHHPDGWFNLGVAHGVPGVVGVLGAACAHGVAVERARPLLEGAVRWLLAQEDTRDEGGFPSWMEPGGGRGPVARTAWCYGDPGVAAVLLAVARALGVPEWEARALAIARRAAARRPERTRVADAGLCHGAAGLGHLLHRVAHTTGDEALAGAARAWFERALELRRPVHEDGPGLLTGVTGTGLALLAAVGEEEPGWDKVLLASLPGPPA
ncbi:lanthionine synthetase LanC family protein [Archangium lipolyticum]|uniref:lanthionine synthetase LanC family protein n=1 Tax=Archangium lipolyticum TaxID=2970465 RepID=UPI00214A3DD4|nr:lanthionine synthetase LanC family protein [Archangium lipolyticum]